MFERLEDKAKIVRAQRILEATIRASLKRRTKKAIGYPGGRVFDYVSTDNTFWHRSDPFLRASVPRLLNWFGLFSEDTSLQITVEVNVPIAGSTGQVSGFFAKDTNTSIIYLMHTGKVGGGHPGVGKYHFLAWSNATLVEARDQAGRTTLAVPVMPIESLDGIASALRYVASVVDFKRAVRLGATDTPEIQRRESLIGEMYAEARGKRTVKRADYDYVTRHGEVVDALAAWRQAEGLSSRQRLAKDQRVDMAVVSKTTRKLEELYEVKSSIDRQAIYTAIGQLLVHADDAVERFIVLPSVGIPPPDLTDALSRLGIEIITYELRSKSVRILG